MLRTEMSFSITTMLLVIIFAGTIFLSSPKFNNEYNSIKWFWGVIGTLVCFLWVLLSEKDLRALAEKCFSPKLLKYLFGIGVLQALYAFGQFCGYVESNHAFLQVTGSFENPAGLVSALTLLFPIGLSWLVNAKGLRRLLIIIQLLLLLFIVIVCNSRTGLMAIFISVFVFCLTSFRQFRKTIIKLPVLCCAIVVIVLFIYFLYHWKFDSSNGRLLILLVSLRMISKKPLFGYGSYGFTANYMSNQADFFLQHPVSDYSVLADNINHPLNEYINIAVCYGIVGLAIVLGIAVFATRSVIRHHSEQFNIWLAIIVSLAVLSMFSYPFHYAHTWFVVILMLVYSLKEYIPKYCGYFGRVPFMVFCIGTILFEYFVLINEMRWKAVEQRALNGHSFYMMKYYDILYPNMRHNYLFLYNYAAELNVCGHYEESVQIVSEFIGKLNDYDTQLLLADNFENMRDSAATVAAYTLAHNMIPNRFIPLYGQMKLYLSYGDSIKALAFANQILNKYVKIPSEMVDKMRIEANLVSNTMNSK